MVSVRSTGKRHKHLTEQMIKRAFLANEHITPEENEEFKVFFDWEYRAKKPDSLYHVREAHFSSRHCHWGQGRDKGKRSAETS